MSPPNSDEVNTNLTGVETHSLGNHEVEDVGNAATSSSVPIMSEKVSRQRKATTYHLTKELERLCNAIRVLRWEATKSSEKTSDPN